MKMKVEKQRMRGGMAWADTMRTLMAWADTMQILMAWAGTAVSIFVCLLLPAGCSSDAWSEGMDTEAVNNDPVPVSIMDASLDAESISAPASRAATTSSLAINGKVLKMFLIDANNSGAKYTNRYQEAYTYNSSAGAWQATKPFYVDSRYAKICACYDPNNAVGFQTNSTKTANTGSMSVKDNADNQLWYYYAPAGSVNNTNAQLSFTLKCAYSRLTLSLSKTSDYPNACKVSKIVIKPSTGTFVTSGYVNILDGSLSAAVSSPYTITTTGMSMYTTGLTTTADTSIDKLFPAQKLPTNAGLTFTLTVDGKDYSVTVPATKFNEFKRGVRHTANLVMSGAGIAISSVTTTDWPAATEIKTDATFD